MPAIAAASAAAAARSRDDHEAVADRGTLRTCAGRLDPTRHVVPDQARVPTQHEQAEDRGHGDGDDQRCQQRPPGTTWQVARGGDPRHPTARRRQKHQRNHERGKQDRSLDLVRGATDNVHGRPLLVSGRVAFSRSRRTTFSTTMIASSTSTPSAMARPRASSCEGRPERLQGQHAASTESGTRPGSRKWRAPRRGTRRRSTRSAALRHAAPR